MLRQSLTPPPSFSALRVRPRVRAPPLIDRDENVAPTSLNTQSVLKSDVSPARAIPVVANGELSSSTPRRGRTLARPMHVRLSVNTQHHHQSLQLQHPHVPTSCSPPPSRRMSGGSFLDDELLFRMSPVLPDAPSSLFREAGNAPFPETYASQHQPIMQTVASWWEGQKRFMAGEVSPPHRDSTALKASRPRAQSKTHVRRRRSHQHQRVRSDFVSREPNDNSIRNLAEDGRTQLNWSSFLSGPITPTSPAGADAQDHEHEQPFMYSFPTFESSPLQKARLERQRRAAQKQAKYISSPESHDTLKPVVGPIRARNLRIQSTSSIPSSGEMLGRQQSIELNDVDDGNVDNDDDHFFISSAFRSINFESARGSTLSYADDEEDGGFGSSQPCSSSVSSSSLSSTSNATGFDDSDILPTSLLASFPVRHVATARSPSASLEGLSSSVHTMDGSPIQTRGRPVAPGRFYIGGSRTHSTRDIRRAEDDFGHLSRTPAAQSRFLEQAVVGSA